MYIILKMFSFLLKKHIIGICIMKQIDKPVIYGGREDEYWDHSEKQKDALPVQLAFLKISCVLPTFLLMLIEDCSSSC